MKKISYLLILFISLFIVSNVKANVECNYGTNIKYTFADNGVPISKTIENSSIGTPDSAVVVEYSNDSERIIVNDGNPICPRSDRYYVDGKDSTGKEILKYTNYDTDINAAGGVVGCSAINNYNYCINNPDFACVWVERDTGKVLNENASYSDAYCNVDNLQYVQCGNIFDIHTYLPEKISFVINALKIATPIILIFVSVITLLKSITADKEDEMEKAKKTLIRRIIIAVIIFFTITITQFVIDKVADDGEPDELSSCFNCFINNTCDFSTYYKNNINGTYKCFYTESSNPFSAEDQKEHCH